METHPDDTATFEAVHKPSVPVYMNKRIVGYVDITSQTTLPILQVISLTVKRDNYWILFADNIRRRVLMVYADITKNLTAFSDKLPYNMYGVLKYDSCSNKVVPHKSSDDKFVDSLSDYFDIDKVCLYKYNTTQADFCVGWTPLQFLNYNKGIYGYKHDDILYIYDERLDRDCDELGKSCQDMSDDQLANLYGYIRGGSLIPPRRDVQMCRQIEDLLRISNRLME